MTKLTLKSTLSPITQAKITSLMTDTLKQTDKKASKSLLKGHNKGKSSQRQSKSLPQSIEQHSRNLIVTSSQAAEQKTQQFQSKTKRSYYTLEERIVFKERISGAQTWLQETFPIVFDPITPKPLKRHIIIDLFPLLPATVTRTQLRDTLAAWVMRQAYHQSLLNHEQRYDLEGKAVETILLEHQEHARQQLARKQAQFKKQQQRLADYRKNQKTHK